jgi:hypothetical protein
MSSRSEVTRPMDRPRQLLRNMYCIGTNTDYSKYDLFSCYLGNHKEGFRRSDKSTIDTRPPRKDQQELQHEEKLYGSFAPVLGIWYRPLRMLRNDNAHSAHHDVSLMTRHRPKRWRPVGEQGTGVSSWQSRAEDPRDCSAWKTTDGAKGMCHQTLARLVKIVVLCHMSSSAARLQYGKQSLILIPKQ